MSRAIVGATGPTPQNNSFVRTLQASVDHHRNLTAAAESERDDAAARVREVEAERDELYRLLEVAQEELRALRPLRDRVLLGALDTLEVRG